MGNFIIVCLPFAFPAITIPLVLATFFGIKAIYSEYYYFVMSVLFLVTLIFQRYAKSEKVKLAFNLSYLWNFFGWVGLITFATVTWGPI